MTAAANSISERHLRWKPQSRSGKRRARQGQRDRGPAPRRSCREPPGSASRNPARAARPPAVNEPLREQRLTSRPPRAQAGGPRDPQALWVLQPCAGHREQAMGSTDHQEPDTKPHLPYATPNRFKTNNQKPRARH